MEIEVGKPRTARTKDLDVLRRKRKGKGEEKSKDDVSADGTRRNCPFGASSAVELRGGCVAIVVLRVFSVCVCVSADEIDHIKVRKICSRKEEKTGAAQIQEVSRRLVSISPSILPCHPRVDEGVCVCCSYETCSA